MYKTGPVGVALLASLAHGEKIWTKEFTIPKVPGEVVVQHFIHIPAGGTSSVQVLEPIDSTAGTGVGETLFMPAKSFALLSAESGNKDSKNSLQCCDEADGSPTKCPKQNGVARDTTLPGVRFLDISKRGDSIGGVPAGEYLLVTARCYKDQPRPNVLAKGELSVRYTHGYIPATEKDVMTFYGALAATYAVVFIGYTIYCLVLWRSVLFSLHYYVIMALFVGLVESCCWYASYYHWNLVGHRWKTMVHLAVAGTCVKRCVTYVLLLLAAMGVGLSKGSVGSSGTWCRICALSVGYFTFTYLYLYLLSDSSQSYIFLASQVEISDLEQVSLPLLASVTETMFVYWILTSLDTTIRELTDAGQTVKLEPFLAMDKVKNAVGGIVLILGCGALYSTFNQPEDVPLLTEISGLAQQSFFSHVLTHILYLGVVLAVMVLWRPNERSKDLAYSVQLVDDQDVPTVQGVDVELGDEDDDGDFKKEIEMVEKQ